MNEAKDKATTGIRESAAEWVVRWNTAEVIQEEEGAFFDWLRRSPLHVKEYLRAEATWLAMEAPIKDDSSDVHTLLREQPANLVELNAGAKYPEAAAVIGARAPELRRRLAIAAAVLLVLGFTSALWLTDRFNTDLYSTSVGELRQIVMPDGSAMQLNTHSKVRVRMSQTSRDVYLDKGEAYFEVARDPQRPFRVISDTAIVRALGTQFNVYRQSQKTVVTVIEGRVAVSVPTANQPVELSAGRVAESAGSAVAIQPAAVDPKAATAWREHRLIFKNQPLAEVIAEFNRYNRQQLVIEDRELASERISAVFDANDSRALVRFLAQQSDVRGRELSGTRLLLVRPGE